MPTQEAIDEDSGAVLAFEDARVPVDRYIMRTFCEVMRHTLETRLFDLDDRGRWVIPLPGQDSAKFRNAIDVLHGLKPVWYFETLPVVLELIECMEYLGATVHESALDSKLWCLVKAGDMEDIMPHLPRFLRHPLVAAEAVRKLIRLRPMWPDFLADVLRPLEASLDAKTVRAVVSYAPNFFPPAGVVWWAVNASRALPAMSQDFGMKLAGQHGSMYHPFEAMGMLKMLGRFGEREGWSPALTGLLKNFAHSAERYDVLPASASKAHGSLIKFHTLPMASVLVLPEVLPRAALRLTPWMKLTFSEAGFFDVHFRPRRIDDDSSRCAAVQLRITCHDRSDGPQGACAECWYLFQVHADATYSLANAYETLGDTQAASRMVRLKPTRQLRFDFFYGVTSVLQNPFDPNSLAESTITFLSM